MIQAHIDFDDNFTLLNEEIERRVLEALNAGASDMAAVANSRSQGLKVTFSVMAARRTLSGWAAAVSASTPLWRVFDKGSLGHRTAKLKRDRRKESWQVNRKGTTYTAHRRSTDTGGVTARNISSPARSAGRAALLAALRR